MKKIPSPVLFSTIGCCLIADTYLEKPRPRSYLKSLFLLFGQEKHNINASVSKL